MYILMYFCLYFLLAMNIDVVKITVHQRKIQVFFYLFFSAN